VLATWQLFSVFLYFLLLLSCAVASGTLHEATLWREAAAKAAATATATPSLSAVEAIVR